MFPNEQVQDNFFNSIGLISLLVGVQNLQENRQQTAANDVHAANEEQAKLLLTEIRKLFQEQNDILEEQNRTLEKQNEMLERLLTILEK